MSDFEYNIYQEHIAEASFLYELRQNLFDNPETTWLRIGDFEERFDAHIDGLLIGGKQALAVCQQSVSEGDAGELHVAMCVFCRLGRKDLVMQSIEKLDPEDNEGQRVIGDALNMEMPIDWRNDFITMLGICEPHHLLILSKLAGYRRFPAGEVLLNVLPEKKSENQACILWSLGRLNYKEACSLILEKYLRSKDESVSIDAALALMRMGEKEALNYCMQSFQSQNWPHTLIGIGGDRSAVSVLLKKAAEKKAVNNCLIDLGLLGDISAVEILLAHIEDPESAESAVLALNLITGAEIYEDAFIPDTVDEDELFPEEIEKFRQGLVPTKPDGTPYGVTITRLSQKPGDWQNWWANNRPRFEDGIRYRNGKPFSPLCLLENIEYEKSPFIVRQLAYEELVIRYGMDFPFEADMYVTQQKRVIKDIALWMKVNTARFRPGAWYFAGQLLS
ncbi:MAG: hypothetical protein ABFD82_17150 [Syntrophaceae bacterium]